MERARIDHDKINTAQDESCVKKQDQRGNAESLMCSGIIAGHRLWRLFGFFLLFYSLGLHFYQSNTIECNIFENAKSLALRGDFSINYEPVWLNLDRNFQNLGEIGVLGVDGRNYNPFGLLTAFLLLPFIWFGAFLGWISGLLGFAGSKDWIFLISQFFPAFCGAAITVVFYKLSLLYIDSRNSLLLTIACALSLPLWQHCTYINEFLPMTLFLLLSVLSLLTYHRRGRKKDVFVAGLFYGLMILTRFASIVFFPVFILFLFFSGRFKGVVGRKMLMEAGSFSLGFLPAFIFFVALNYWRFGSWISPGYLFTTHNTNIAGVFDSSLLVSLYGLLCSPGRGLLFYAPIMLIFPVIFYFFTREYPVDSFLLNGLFLFNLFFFALFRWWFLPGFFGPGYITFLLPLAFLQFVLFFRCREGLLRFLVILLFLVSVSVQLISVFIEPLEFDDALGEYYGFVHFQAFDPSVPVMDARIMWDPAYHPLKAYAKLFYCRSFANRFNPGCRSGLGLTDFFYPSVIIIFLFLAVLFRHGPYWLPMMLFGLFILLFFCWYSPERLLAKAEADLQTGAFFLEQGRPLFAARYLNRCLLQDKDRKKAWELLQKAYQQRLLQLGGVNLLASDGTSPEKSEKIWNFHGSESDLRAPTMSPPLKMDGICIENGGIFASFPLMARYEVYEFVMSYLTAAENCRVNIIKRGLNGPEFVTLRTSPTAGVWRPLYHVLVTDSTTEQIQVLLRSADGEEACCYTMPDLRQHRSELFSGN